MIDIANDLDLYGDELVEITKRAKDTREITVSESEFSKAFSVPSSARNNAVFGFYANIDVDSTINPHKAIPAFWTIYRNTRYTGVIEVKGCVYENGQPKSYNLVFYGKVKNLSTTFGEDRLTDIDWSSMDHDLTPINVTNSWAGGLQLSSGPFTTDLMYPLVDYEVNYFLGAEDQDIEGNIRNRGNGILIGNLKPAIKFRKMIQLIFENYGLTISGTLDDSSIDGWFVQPNNRAGSLVDYEEFSANYINVFGISQVIPTNGSDIIIQMPTENQDDNNNWATDTFTTPLTGGYTFAWNFQAFISSASPLFKFEGFIEVNGVEVFTQQFGSTIVDVLETTVIWEPDLIIGDTVQFGFRELLPFNPTITINISRLQTIDLPSVEEGVVMQLVNTMPNDKITDYINGILKAFRWVVVPGEFEGEWQFLSEQDWRDQGVSRDWSNFIDLKTISYQKPNVYKSIRLTTAESESAIQTAFSADQQRRFGEVRITPDVDFGQAEFVVESIFTLWPPSVYNVLNEQAETIETSVIPIYKMLDIEGSPTQDKYLLFYNEAIVGDLPESQSFFMQTGVVSGDPIFGNFTNYPVCGFSSGGLVVGNSDDTTTYSIETPLSGEPPIETVYKKYWESELYNIYANGARVCTAEFALPQDQFLSFNLNDTVFCEGRKWYIDELKYNILSGKAKATLRSKQPIESRPKVVSVDGGGKINFSGDPDAFVRSAVNAGAQLAGAYYLQTSRAALLGNKMKYTEAKADTFITYITGITGDLIGWGDE